MNDLDPDAERLLTLRARRGYRAYPELGVERSRRQYADSSAAFGFDKPLGIVTEDLTVTGRSGPIGLRRYLPENPHPGVVVYFHGGGWVIGGLDTHDSIARCLASVSGRQVIAVDYRLAPEHPFPAAVNDAEDAVHSCAGSRVAGSEWISVAGDSAGATLALVAARAAARAGRPVASQMLIYPAIDLSGESFRRAAAASDGRLSADVMEWFIEKYGGDQDASDPRFSPWAGDAAADPPTLVVTAGDDVLHDEGVDYANRLRAAGTTVHHLDFPGHPHGFLTAGSVVGAATTVIEAMASFMDGTE